MWISRVFKLLNYTLEQWTQNTHVILSHALYENLVLFPNCCCYWQSQWCINNIISIQHWKRIYIFNSKFKFQFNLSHFNRILELDIVIVFIWEFCNNKPLKCFNCHWNALWFDLFERTLTKGVFYFSFYCFDITHTTFSFLML